MSERCPHEDHERCSCLRCPCQGCPCAGDEDYSLKRPSGARLAGVGVASPLDLPWARRSGDGDEFARRYPYADQRAADSPLTDRL